MANDIVAVKRVEAPKFGLFQIFNKVGDKPIAETRYRTHLHPSVKPREWLDRALAMAQGMGIDNSAVEVTSTPQSLIYKIQFNHYAQVCQMLTALDGIRESKKGFPLDIYIGANEPDERMDEYVDAILTFCEPRNIACHVDDASTDKQRKLKFSFDRNVDIYAVRLSMHEGDISRMLRDMKQRREAASANVDIAGAHEKHGSGGAVVAIVGLLGMTAYALRHK